MSPHELQWRLLFSVIVAGKSEKFARLVMWKLFEVTSQKTPFETIREIDARRGRLGRVLRKARSGNYHKLEISFRALATSNINLETCTAPELEAFHGIGPKTARFFLLWTRPGARLAALDTHVLKWLRFVGYNAPKSTPPPILYAELEAAFIAEADKRCVSPRILDAAIWDFCRMAHEAKIPENERHWPSHLHANMASFPDEVRKHYESWSKEDEDTAGTISSIDLAMKT